MITKHTKIISMQAVINLLPPNPEFSALRYNFPKSKTTIPQLITILIKLKLPITHD